jgi:protein-tyrosine phosphatase
MKKILFVCTGNICRSPTAEGVLRHRAREAGHADIIQFDSAGTHNYHVGAPPDPRSIQTALSRGIDIQDLRARKLLAPDYQDFDLILALDNSHLRHIREIAPKEAKAKAALFLEYAGATKETEVPDPYYGNQRDFEYVLDLIEAAALPLIKKLHTG